MVDLYLIFLCQKQTFEDEFETIFALTYFISSIGCQVFGLLIYIEGNILID